MPGIYRAAMVMVVPLLAGTIAPTLAFQTTGNATDAATLASFSADSAVDTEAAAKLAAAIRADIAGQPDTASAEDYEGIIVFDVSQGAYNDPTISAALDILSVGASEKLATAIANVRIALLGKKLKRGTAALGGGGYGSGAGTGGGGGGGFTAPGVSTGGGGSSNYTN
ncbi:hypothetical protein [Sphingobium sp.]|uniref:hypothetical protein n=1 Tax=Sphingobium sp. TaxID=1912891 RepID=UPI003BB6E86A